MTKGRTVPPLPTFTFKDTGITVGLRKLSPYVGDQIGKAIRKERPAPKPPLNEVDYGDGKKVSEENTADASYQRALAEYEQWVAFEAGQRTIRAVLDYAIALDTDQVDADAVAQARAMMAAIGAPLDDDISDRDVYIKYVCLGTQEDLSDLLEAATRRSQPTEAAIAENVTAFRS